MHIPKSPRVNGGFNMAMTNPIIIRPTPTPQPEFFDLLGSDSK